jgi:flagellin
MNVLTGADVVLLNLDRNQQAFEKTVSQLSSGLRINSAADDPSGNAIATNLTSKVGGLQQAVNNVQNGINALNVANGALASVQGILERINVLLVESNSDINSASDLQNIQTEIDSLLTEINTISEKTNFNGLTLLNGAFDTSPGTNPSFTQVASPFGGTTSVTNYNNSFTPQPGPLVTQAGVPLVNGAFVPALMVFTVTGYSDDAVDPDSDTNVGPGVYVQFDAYSLSSANTGTDFLGAPLYQDVSAVAVGGGQTGITDYVTPAGTGLLLNFNLSNLTAADVGASIAFLSQAGTAASTGTALTINDGGDEGQTLGFSLPSVSTNALGISDISVLAPQTVGIVPGSFNTPVVNGQSASNVMTASNSQVLVQQALTTVTTSEAQIGAQIVAMNDDNSDDNTTIVNLQSSVSDIADLNVGQATTQYTQEQILTSVGTEVLSQIQSNAKIMTALLIQALIA